MKVTLDYDEYRLMTAALAQWRRTYGKNVPDDDLIALSYDGEMIGFEFVHPASGMVTRMAISGRGVLRQMAEG